MEYASLASSSTEVCMRECHRKRFGLTSDDLRNAVATRRIVVSNAKNPRGFRASMRLYYAFQLKDEATRKHGSWNRVEAAILGRVPRTGTIDGPVLRGKRCRSAKARPGPETFQTIREPHTHEFAPPECVDEESATWEKRCTKCDHGVQWTEI
eukprot:Polyplicarium_translucidae@DN2661_c0_g1_i5.p3